MSIYMVVVWRTEKRSEPKYLAGWTIAQLKQVTKSI